LAARKLWGGRFSSEADSLFAEFNDSLRFDRELLAEDIEGSLAYARALERAGVLSASERRRIERGLSELRSEHAANPNLAEGSDAEDVHTWVEEELVRRIGPAGLKLHTGRSRNDQVATDLRLYLRARCDEVDSQIRSLLETLAELAERHIEVIVPGFTHLQRAQPVLWSHYLMAYAEMLLRDLERLRQARERVNVCPLGSGALSGTVYRVDRHRLAADLGFARPARNSMDAISDRDFVLDFLYFASVLLMHLSRLAEDFIVYSSVEFAFAELDDSVASGSSLMPQKKNPDAFELVRGKSGRVFGHLAALLTVLKGLPMTYNKDLQEDKEGLFDAVRTVSLCLRMTRRLLEKTRVRSETMRRAAETGFLNATELADYLAERGVPFRDAHHLVGRIVRRALELHLELDELPLAEYQRFSALFENDVYDRLKPETAVSRRVEIGGTSPAQVRRALRSLRALLRRSR